MDWRHKAECRTEDPELFFPAGTSGPALAQIAEAKTVCRRCPVRQACLEWALTSGQDAGIWGGHPDGSPSRHNVRTGHRNSA
jgi:WhiB family redox-sensing transcriptional regulator